MDKYIEIAKKLQALAEQGVGGEREAAQKKLDEIMAAHGITKEQLEEIERTQTEFVIKKGQNRLFAQIVYSIIGKRINGMMEHKKNVNKKYVEVTKAEELEIWAKFNHFWTLWEEELDIFAGAFARKNMLYPSEEIAAPTEPRVPTQEEIKRAMRIMEMSENIEKRDYHYQLKDKNKV